MADPAGTEEWTASCSECRFFRDGTCRRYAPRAHAKQIRWPKVASTDWCGEFEYEPKEPVPPPHVGRYMVGGA